MKTLLTTAALAALLTGTPAAAGQDDGARAVSPDEYFGTRTRDADTRAAQETEDEDAPLYEEGEPSGDDAAEALNRREADRMRGTRTQESGQQDRGDLAARLRARDEARRSGNQTPASDSDADDDEMATVTVRVSGVKRDGGDVYLALQTEDGFAGGGGEYTQVVEAGRGGTVTATFEDVEPGRYALAAFQDTDGDGTVTLGKTGPTEPWALSGTASGKPSFDASAFDAAGATRTNVALKGGDKGADGKAMDKAASQDGVTVTVRIRGIKEGEGDLFVALQDEAGFAKAKGKYADTTTPDGRTAEIVFENVKPGEYAASAFQDTDGDGTVTLTDTGPTEPWGVSGRRASGAPDFERAMFEVGEDDATTSVRLREGAKAPAENDSEEASAPAAPAPMGSRASDEDAMSEDAMEEDDREASTSAPAPIGDMDMGDMDMDDDRAAAPSEGPAPKALVYRRAATLSTDALTASDFLGAELVNADGDELAEIVDVIVDPSGRARGVVLATGGLFGLGADHYAVNFDRVQAEREDGDLTIRSLLTDADVDRLREFDYEGFKEDKQGLLLAAQLSGSSIPLGGGETGEDAEVEDIVMAADGSIEAVVLNYDGDTLVAPFDRVRVSQTGEAYIDVGQEGTEGFARYEGRPQTRRLGIFNR